ncbi:MAG: flavin prenyltransferase UbiX [Mariprofundaceae bacterium]
MAKSSDIIIALTGASGSAYALRLIQRVVMAGRAVHLLVSDAARIVLVQESNLQLSGETQQDAIGIAKHLDIPSDQIAIYTTHDWYAPVASGSAGLRHMVVLPCSMGSLAAIAMGTSDNLLERAADVMIKERGQLILVPRESPLSAIHLEQMLNLSRLGVEIIPAMPGFYHQPKTIADLVDFMVDRIMDRLEIEDDGVQRWGV